MDILLIKYATVDLKINHQINTSYRIRRAHCTKITLIGILG